MSEKYLRCNLCGAPNSQKGKCEYCGIVLEENSDFQYSGPAKSYFDLGIYEYTEGNIEKASKIFDKIILQDSKNSYAWFYKYVCDYNDVSDSYMDFDSLLEKIRALKNIFRSDLVENELLRFFKLKLMPPYSEYSNYYYEKISFSEYYSYSLDQSERFQKVILSQFIGRYDSLCWFNGLNWSLDELLSEVNEFNTNLIFVNLDVDSKYDVLTKVKALIKKKLQFYSSDKDIFSVFKEKYHNDYLPKCQKIITCLKLQQDEFSIENLSLELFSKEIEQLAPPITIAAASSKKSGCFIATAATGSYNHPLVVELRDFRDNWILKKSWGEGFVNWYYKYGSIAAKLIEKSSILRKFSYCFIVKPVVFFSRKTSK